MNVEVSEFVSKNLLTCAATDPNIHKISNKANQFLNDKKISLTGDETKTLTMMSGWHKLYLGSKK